MAKKYLFLICKCAGIILLSAAIGFVLLLGAYLLPTAPIQRHIAASADLILDEGDYPFVHDWIDMWRDNYTDYLMINHAGYGGTEPLVEKAVNVYSVTGRYQGKELLPSLRLIVGYSDLIDLEENGVTLRRNSYARYWHGYLIVLKPLLCLFTYGQARIVNAVFQTLLLLAALYLMWKKHARGLIVPFALVWWLLVPKDTAALFQYTDIFCIYVIGTIVILLFYERFRKTNALYYTFLLLGIATSYFDYLTYPLVSLAVPLGICLYLSDHRTVREGLKQIAAFSALWAVGYLGMWACKWLLVSVFSDESIMEVVGEKVKAWTSNESDLGEHVTLFATVGRLFSKLIPNPAFWCTAVYIVILAVISAVKKTFRKVHLVLFGILALYPFAWFLVVSSHSYSHYWFTHKELVIFLFSLMLLFTSEWDFLKKAAEKRAAKAAAAKPAAGKPPAGKPADGKPSGGKSSSGKPPKGKAAKRLSIEAGLC